MEFLKTHGRLISNILIVILVAMAIFVKVSENGTDDFIHEKDMYIFAGAVLVLLLMHIFQRNRNNKRWVIRHWKDIFYKSIFIFPAREDSLLLGGRWIAPKKICLQISIINAIIFVRLGVRKCIWLKLM